MGAMKGLRAVQSSAIAVCNGGVAFVFVHISTSMPIPKGVIMDSENLWAVKKKVAKSPKYT